MNVPHVRTEDRIPPRNVASSTSKPIHESMPEVQFEDCSKLFLSPTLEPNLAVTDISLTVDRGKFVCIVGPSGCGKSTLLNMVAGLMSPTRGKVSYRGEPVVGVNTSVGYMTQKDNLLPWRTLHKNVAISLEIQRVPRKEIDAKVDKMLERVGLESYGSYYPSQLSGGMRKRATLARTLIYEPDTLLMDEPFASLDAQRRLLLQSDLLQIWERDKKTVLFVTHDLEEAIALADQIVVFGTRPGRIVHIEDVHLPRPRSIVELRHIPEFNELWHKLWALLEAEIATGAAAGERALR